MSTDDMFDENGDGKLDLDEQSVMMDFYEEDGWNPDEIWDSSKNTYHEDPNKNIKYKKAPVVIDVKQVKRLLSFSAFLIIVALFEMFVLKSTEPFGVHFFIFLALSVGYYVSVKKKMRSAMYYTKLFLCLYFLVMTCLVIEGGYHCRMEHRCAYKLCNSAAPIFGKYCKFHQSILDKYGTIDGETEQKYFDTLREKED
ncbi:MAG: hypothetical protein K6A30_06530 [Lachnospiraceae bacterium]|nr:hypothetical protein [Lachnospiraceae bacterium]